MSGHAGYADAYGPRQIWGPPSRGGTFNWKGTNIEPCTCQESSPASSLSPPEGATSLPPGLITSLHTPVHPLITSLHTPVHLLITLSCSQCVDYLCTSAPSLCLPRLLLPALTCLYFTVFIIWPITFGFVHSGHQHYVAVWGVPFLIIVLFFPVGFWFYY